MPQSRQSRFAGCEYLEERLLFALAKATGGSGYSGTLSSNTAIRQQQLICDPIAPVAGSTSVRYDASKVSLTGLIPGPGYNNFGFIGLVEVRLTNGNTLLQPYAAYRQNPLGTETGYAQVLYKLEGSAGQITPPGGYTIIEEKGVEGVDTHAFFFTLRPGVSTTTEVAYKVYAERRDVHSNNREDGLTTDTGEVLGPDDLAPVEVSSNFAPRIVSTGGPYTINEGGSLTLSCIANDVETFAHELNYQWDVNNDGVVDAVGANATLSAEQLRLLGLADGPKTSTIRLTVSDPTKSTTATTSLTVRNVAPAVSLSVSPTSNQWVGVPLTISANVTDPALFDTFSYAWKVNNTAVAGNASTLTFTPTAPGTYAFNSVVTDDDGGVGSANLSVTVTVDPSTVARAAVLPDPAYPGQRALFVWGTRSSDAIGFGKSGNNTSVTVNGSSLGAFSGFNRMIVRGLAGNDNVTINYTAASEVLFFGGDGDDRLVAGNYQSIVVGGPGNDELISGNAKDLLAGGLGSDTLRGGTGDDLLVADRSIYDDGSDADNERDIRAWSLLMREWVSGKSLAVRQANIIGQTATGLNGQFVLRSVANALGPATLFSDAVPDLLDGGGGTNWLLTV
jgi:Ca2+-binding RTX toxin-like protein